MRVVITEPDAGTIRARDTRAVPGPRAVGAVPVDLAEVGDSLADVKDGCEGGVPRHVAQDIVGVVVVVVALRRGLPRL